MAINSTLKTKSNNGFMLENHPLYAALVNCKSIHGKKSSSLTLFGKNCPIFFDSYKKSKHEFKIQFKLKTNIYNHLVQLKEFKIIKKSRDKKILFQFVTTDAIKSSASKSNNLKFFRVLNNLVFLQKN